MNEKRGDAGGEGGNIDLFSCRWKAKGNVGFCHKCHWTSNVRCVHQSNRA